MTVTRVSRDNAQFNISRGGTGPIRACLLIALVFSINNLVNQLGGREECHVTGKNQSDGSLGSISMWSLSVLHCEIYLLIMSYYIQGK